MKISHTLWVLIDNFQQDTERVVKQELKDREELINLNGDSESFRKWLSDMVFMLIYKKQSTNVRNVGGSSGLA